MVITGGTVEFSRTVKPADYESKGAKVVLSFGIDEGEDTQSVLERVSAIAMRHALSMVGELPAKLAWVEVPATTVEKPKRQSRKPVDPATIEEIAERVEPGRPPETEAVDEGTRSVDPAAIEDIEEAPAEAAAIVISPKDLAAACAEKREAVGVGYDVMAVRKLIGEYAAPGIGMSNIPPEKRQAFLDALKAL